MTARRRIAVAVLAVFVAVGSTSCIEPNTFSSSAAPEHDEADRLQTVVNDRPDLEIARGRLTELDAQIRSAVAEFAPSTVFGPSTPKPDRSCVDPFGHSIGETFGIEQIYARPAPTAEQFQRITTALQPIFDAAGLRPNSPADQPPPPGVFSHVADDGTTVELTNSPTTVLVYGYSTGCRLPAAWRTSPPPPDRRPVDDPNVHYPYLFGSDGGRSG